MQILLFIFVMAENRYINACSMFLCTAHRKVQYLI